MLKNFLMAAMLTLPLLGLSACDGGGFTVTSQQLKPGGAFISYVQSSNCEGCSELGRGDLIQEIDGKAIATTEDVLAANITDGQPHEIKFWDHPSKEVKTIKITATPNDSMAPIKAAPPFWTVGAAELDKAPEWARRRLFGHAAPQLLLVNSDGGLVNGRDLYGKKHLMVFFDWTTQNDQRNGALMLKVLQKAQADLNAKGVDILFAQIQHPSERALAPMNDTDLRNFFQTNQVSEGDGGPLPPPPLYRSPNKTENSPANVLGMEGAFNFMENIGEPPNVFVIDEHGIIRWHSAGVTPDPSGEIPDEAQYTIVSAVKFALENL